MKGHPTFERLVDLIEDRLPEATRHQVLAHLASGCELCRVEIESIKDLLYLLKHETLSEPPAAAAVRWADRLFRTCYLQPAAGRRTRLIAHLLFDSWLIPAGLAARGPGRERHILYGAEGLDIDLQVSAERDRDTLRLMGQVMPISDDALLVGGRPVRLAQEDRVVAIATTDELGAFAFRALAAGHYELWFDLPHADVWIPGLILRPTWTE